MKKLNIILLMLVVLASACKKDNKVFFASSTVNVINAAIDAGAVKVNPGVATSFYYASAPSIAYGANLYQSTFTDSKTFTVVSATDTTKTLLSPELNLQKPINTLYLVGQAPNVTAVFTEENNVPFLDSSPVKPDSSIYVRFVNLSPTSTPLDIKIKDAAGNTVSGLAYKGVSPFVKYAARVNPTNYIFEVRDAATNTLRLTYTVNAVSTRYKTMSLVIKGLMDPSVTGTNAFGISQINYFN